jgi:hypothetical protein
MLLFIYNISPLTCHSLQQGRFPKTSLGLFSGSNTVARMWSEAPKRIDHLLSALLDGHLALDVHYHGLESTLPCSTIMHHQHGEVSLDSGSRVSL